MLFDTLPASTPFVSSSTTLGTCSGAFTVTCLVSKMTPGQTADVTITARAPLTPGATGANTATVTTGTIDPALPNTASASSTVLATPLVCASQPGKDGAGGLLGGVVNGYWPGNASAAAGATSIALGARRGAAPNITAGDLVLIVQMQDAQIDSSNDDRYGSGVGIAGGTLAPGAGVTNANNTGRYEYAVVTNTVGAGGGTLTLGGGLLFAYTNANATATAGQRRFQVVRVPQYASATLGVSLTASPWNGRTGGILALDVEGTLALGSTTVAVDGLGFRGGAGRQLAGGVGSSADYRGVAAGNAHGIKGEGIAGTPEHVLDGGVVVDVGPQGIRTATTRAALPATPVAAEPTATPRTTWRTAAAAVARTAATVAAAATRGSRICRAEASAARRSPARLAASSSAAAAGRAAGSSSSARASSRASGHSPPTVRARSTTRRTTAAGAARSCCSRVAAGSPGRR